MATESVLKKFAEQALRVEAVLYQRNIPSSAGRVIYVLSQGSRVLGVSQREVISETCLPKDVISKLVAGLVRTGLLDQHREHSGSKTKRLITTYAGRQLLSMVETELQTRRTALLPPENAQQHESNELGPSFLHLFDTSED